MTSELEKCLLEASSGRSSLACPTRGLNEKDLLNYSAMSLTVAGEILEDSLKLIMSFGSFCRCVALKGASLLLGCP